MKEFRGINIDELLTNDAISKISSSKFNFKFKLLNDDDLNKDTEEKLKQNDRHNISQRDRSSTKFFNSFVEAYTNNAKTNRNLKRAFFVMFMIFLSIMIIVIPMGTIILACLGRLGSTEVMVSLISSAATIVTSIIIIPKIMVEHLFSSEETKVSVELINKLLKSDRKTREIHENNKK